MVVGSLYAELIDGIAIVVKGQGVTLFDIKEEMRISKVDAKKATDILIRKKLEAVEIKERKITVSSGEVYDDIKRTAGRNHLNISEFYEAVRNSSGINSTELKIKIKEKLLSQKLYSAIAYASMSQPTESEIEDYYKLHTERFSHPSGFNVIIYQSSDKNKLQTKINNPMFYSPEIATNEQDLPYDRISPELASLLTKTKEHHFTAPIPDGKGGFMSFYLKKKNSLANSEFKDVENQIVNIMMSEAREKVLGDYFARLRHNADIQYLRDVE